MDGKKKKNKNKNKYITSILTFLSDLHLYNDLEENVLLRVFVLAFAWVGGIYVLWGKPMDQSADSAFFIFSFTQLSEFGLRIRKKRFVVSKLVYVMVCVVILCIALMSFASLIGASLNENHYQIMYYISLVIVIYIVIDSIVLLVVPNSIVYKDEERELNKNLDLQEKEMRLFEKNLYSGCLGSISKGGDIDE